MTDFRQTIHNRLHNRHGVDATYVPLMGAPTPVKVKLRVGVSVFGDDVQFIGDEDQVVFLLTDIADPVKKESFLINGSEYQLVKPLTNDGIRAIWQVKNVD